MRHNQLLLEKIKESLASVLPITAMVLIISITVAPLTPGTMVLFLFGAVLLVVGMGLFTLVVDMSMTVSYTHLDVYKRQVLDRGFP